MWPEWAPRWPLVAIVGLGGAYRSRIATQTFGRVVRYTRADPDNIAARAAVRDRGLKLLEALHEDDSYARIVVVGHSLGTIVAYDLVNYFWARNDGMRSIRIDEPAFDALRRSELAAATLEANPSDGGLAAAFRSAQAGLRRALGQEAREAATRWRISDLVTIGSPLTHAEFLLGSGLADLARRKAERELPTAPPYRERLDYGILKLAEKANLILPDDEDPRLFSFPNVGASEPGRSRRTSPLSHAS